MRLEFSRPHNPGQLLAELSALPDLQPEVKPDGERIARFYLKTLDDRIIVEAPDEADAKAIRAVVEGHKPPAPPDRKSEREADLSRLRTEAGRNPIWASLLRTLGIE